MTSPASTAAFGIVDAKRIVGVERPSGMAYAVMRISLHIRILLGEDVIAENAHSFTPSVHVRKRYKLVLRSERTYRTVGSFVLHPAPVGHENAYERISLQLRVFAVVKLATMLQPPLETQSVRLAVECSAVPGAPDGTSSSTAISETTVFCEDLVRFAERMSFTKIAFIHT